MKSPIGPRLTMLAASVATLVLTAACSGSSGGGSGSVSQSQLEAKLKKEPQIQTLIKQGGKQATAANKLVGCAAKALEKDANQSDLQDYVDGKKDIDAVKPKSSDSKDDAKTTVETCAKTALTGSGLGG